MSETRLTVLRTYQEHTGTQMRTMCDAQCSCGTVCKGLRLTTIVKGNTKSCGCLKNEKAAARTRIRNTTHGLSNHPLFSQYHGMIGRCTYPSHVAWKNYGGRGIDVCDVWRSDFLAFYNWAMSNGWEEGLTIDRKETDGNYEPGNCRFATCREQCNNKRNSRWVEAFGERKTLGMWCSDPRCKAGYVCILNRLDLLGWDAEKAISTPPRSLNRTFK